MNASEAPEISEIVNRVVTWPPQQRVSLARRILETVEVAPQPATGPRGYSADEVIAMLKMPQPTPDDRDDVIQQMQARYPKLFQHSDTAWVRSLIGLAAGDRPPPTDEEVKQWIDEHRMEKYGS